MEKVGKVDYKIDMCGKLKIFYVNMFKLYVERESDIDILGIVGVVVVDIEDEDDGNEILVDLLREVRKEGLIDVIVSVELIDDQCNDVYVLFDEFLDVLLDLFGLMILGVYQIKFISDKFICSKFYLLFFMLWDIVCEEVCKMVEVGVIELFDSLYFFLIVIVKKKDGINRFCIDFRVINKIIVFDVEIIFNVDDIFVKFVGCKYVLKFDLFKGYWQILLGDLFK